MSNVVAVFARSVVSSGTAVGSISATLLVASLAGCGSNSSSDSGGTPLPTVPITGTVSAPGGALAFNAPTGLRRFFAEIFGRSAVAAIANASGVPGVTVQLIQIDDAGAQVGGVVASAVSGAGGAYTIDAPNGFAAGPTYVIHAVGTSATLDRLVTGTTGQDVDPATHVAKSLVIAGLQGSGGTVQGLLTRQLSEFIDQIGTLAANIDPPANTQAAVTALTAEAQRDEELSRQLSNLALPAPAPASAFAPALVVSTTTSTLSGTVTDAGGTPLANVKIVARDFNQWVKQAQTSTDAAGSYVLSIAAGDYIVGALNFTGTSTAASEWWTCDDVLSGTLCGSENMFDAARVTISGAAPAVAIDFKLEPGARVTGSMSASSGGALPGVQLGIRQFSNNQPVLFRTAAIDGTFRANVRPGTYYLVARNRTAAPFASATYDGPAAGGSTSVGGGNRASDATRMDLVAGSTYTVNFNLEEGGKVEGLVTDGAAPIPNVVTGMPVRFDDESGASVQAERTDLTGNYLIWLRPNITYTVRSRGQTQTRLVEPASVTPSPAPLNFGAAVPRATATIFASDGVTPLSQVKVRVYETLSGSQNFVASENSNGDGTVEIYAPSSGSYLIEYKVDNASTTAATAIHNGTAAPSGTTPLPSGTTVAFNTASPTAIGNITLPSGGELTGIIRFFGGAPVSNAVVQVRAGASGATRVTSTRTQSDGSYTISVVPLAGAPDRIPRVCARHENSANNCSGAALQAPGSGVQSINAGDLWATTDNVPFTAGASNTADITFPDAPIP